NANDISVRLVTEPDDAIWSVRLHFLTYSDATLEESRRETTWKDVDDEFQAVAATRGVGHRVGTILFAFRNTQGSVLTGVEANLLARLGQFEDEPFDIMSKWFDCLNDRPVRLDGDT